MKVRIKKSGYRVSSIDRKRSHSLAATLIRQSEKRRRKELAERGKNPSKKRPISVTVVNPPEALKKPEGPSTTVKISMPLNKAGNLKGMHASGDSEGMARIRGMRKLYNKQMPVPQCNNCAFSQTCPKFRAGFECAFLPFLGSHDVQTPEDLMHYMRDLISANFRRAQMATALETLSGGAPSLELSESLMMLFNMSKELFELMKDDDSTGTLDVETNDKTVIGRLFGGMNNLLGETRDAISSPLDSTPLAIEDQEATERMKDGLENADMFVNTEAMADADKIELEKVQKKGKKVVNPTQIISVGTLTKV